MRLTKGRYQATWNDKTIVYLIYDGISWQIVNKDMKFKTIFELEKYYVGTIVNLEQIEGFNYVDSTLHPNRGRT